MASESVVSLFEQSDPSLHILGISSSLISHNISVIEGDDFLTLKIARTSELSRLALRNEVNVSKDITSDKILRVIGHGNIYSPSSSFHGLDFNLVRSSDGGTLSQLNGPNSSSQLILNVIKGAAEALSELHKAGYVHASINPKNIFVDGSEGKISNLALAGKSGSSQNSFLLEKYPHDALGQTDYSPHEQITGQLLSPEMDVFSLAASAIKQITGKLPFNVSFSAERKMPSSLMHMFESNHYLQDLPKTIPVATRELLYGALAFDHCRRPKIEEFIGMNAGFRLIMTPN